MGNRQIEKLSEGDINVPNIEKNWEGYCHNILYL